MDELESRVDRIKFLMVESNYNERFDMKPIDKAIEPITPKEEILETYIYEDDSLSLAPIFQSITEQSTIIDAAALATKTGQRKGRSWAGAEEGERELVVRSKGGIGQQPIGEDQYVPSKEKEEYKKATMVQDVELFIDDIGAHLSVVTGANMKQYLKIIKKWDDAGIYRSDVNGEHDPESEYTRTYICEFMRIYLNLKQKSRYYKHAKGAISENNLLDDLQELNEYGIYDDLYEAITILTYSPCHPGLKQKTKPVSLSGAVTYLRDKLDNNLLWIGVEGVVVATGVGKVPAAIMWGIILIQDIYELSTSRFTGKWRDQKDETIGFDWINLNWFLFVMHFIAFAMVGGIAKAIRVSVQGLDKAYKTAKGSNLSKEGLKHLKTLQKHMPKLKGAINKLDEVVVYIKKIKNNEYIMKLFKPEKVNKTIKSATDVVNKTKTNMEKFVTKIDALIDLNLSSKEIVHAAKKLKRGIIAGSIVTALGVGSKLANMIIRKQNYDTSELSDEEKKACSKFYIVSFPWQEEEVDYDVMFYTNPNCTFSAVLKTKETAISKSNSYIINDVGTTVSLKSGNTITCELFSEYKGMKDMGIKKIKDELGSSWVEVGI